MRHAHALILRTALAATVTAALLGAGCSTRESRPTATADSTWVYPSKLPGDVTASITFSQKGGTQPAEVRRSVARKKASASRAKATTTKATTTKTSADRATTASTKKQSSAAGSEKPAAPIEPRAFDIQQDARVIATVTLENQRARGERPLVLHFVWLKPNMRTAYKKMVEYDPFGSETTLTSAFSIPPDRRSPGVYTFRVYLHRELIAEKTFELRGSGLEQGDDGGVGI